MNTQPLPTENLRVSASDLRNCDYECQGHFTIHLSDGSELFVEEVLRILPGKRIVAHALHHDKKCIVKIFFHQKRAKTHADRETKAYASLVNYRIPTPKLLSVLQDAEKKMHVLCFAYLDDAASLMTLWQNREVLDIAPLLARVVKELATQHVLGIKQNDMHFGNFMLNEQLVFTLDGGSVEFHQAKLSAQDSFKHLAAFFSLMGVSHRALQRELFTYYCVLRGMAIKTRDEDRFYHYVQEANRKRLAVYAEKITRSTSHFLCFKNSNIHGVCDRRLVTQAERAELLHPERFLCTWPTEIIKKGRSATVMKVKVGAAIWIVKHYHVKNYFKRLRRGFFKSRAFRSWAHAQKLQLFGVKVPKPIAFIEKRVAGFCVDAYFISEYIDGVPLDVALRQYKDDERASKILLQEVRNLLQGLQALEWSHGDLKATNILVKAGLPYLIDFDGASEHTSLLAKNAAHARDRARLLKNFRGDDAVLKRIKESF